MDKDDSHFTLVHFYYFNICISYISVAPAMFAL